MSDRTSLPAWKDLQAHAADLEIHHLRQLIADDPQRFERLSVAELDFLYDFTRQRLTANTVNLLLELARACGLEERIQALFAGEAVNNTERRAAMHMALRNRSDRPMPVDGRDVMPDVRAELAKMREFVTGVHEGRITGAKGARFTDVVNIGIGGSDLGIVMATEALGALPQSRHAAALRVEHRRRRAGRSDRAGEPGDHAVRHLLQDVHHARDVEQRQCGARVARRRARHGGHRQAFRGRLDQPRGNGRVRHRARVALHDVGLGRRPLFTVVRGGAVDRAGARHGPVRARAAGRPRHGRALPHGTARAQPAGADGPDRRVERQLPRSRLAGRAAVRPPPAPLLRPTCSSSRWSRTARA